jgi:hypothetical protein
MTTTALRFTMVLGLSVSTALFPLCVAQVHAQAEVDNLPPGIITGYHANIGYRSSRRSGERSSFKWVSRLMKQYAKTPTQLGNSYIVRWHTYERGRRVNYSLAYTIFLKELALTKWRSSKLIHVDGQQVLPTYRETWSAVSAATIHSGAQNGRSLTNLPLFK